MILALTIVHVVIALALIVVVLMQHGKQQGLSGAIAGGAETFFGKNKGRTVDAMLKKFTSVVAILFIITSVALAALTAQNNAPAADAGTGAEAAQSVSMDEAGNLVDAEGNIVMTAEDMAAQEAAAAAEGENAEAPAEGEAAPAEEVPAEEAPAAE